MPIFRFGYGTTAGRARIQFRASGKSSAVRPILDRPGTIQVPQAPPRPREVVVGVFLALIILEGIRQRIPEFIIGDSFSATLAYIYLKPYYLVFATWYFRLKLV